MKKIASAFLKTVGLMCCIAATVSILIGVRLLFGETAFFVFGGIALFIIIFIGFYKLIEIKNHDNP